VAQKNSMSIIAYAVTISLLLGSSVMGLSGCAEINLKSPPNEVKAFFVAGKEAHYLALQCPTSGYVDLSAYSHLMGVKYPRTFQVDVLRNPPSRPYKSFAMLECELGPHSKSEEVVEGLKDKAREIGADAIILCQGGPDSGLPGITPGAIMQAVAIRYILTSASDKGNNS
jgi:hypothetical protein